MAWTSMTWGELHWGPPLVRLHVEQVAALSQGPGQTCYVNTVLAPLRIIVKETPSLRELTCYQGPEPAF